MAHGLTSGNGVEPRAVDWAVVIPARNEAQHLGNVLDDLAAQDLQVQILVVDDHSTDVTASLAASHQLAQRGQLRVLTAEGTGKKSALLTGRASASTPWVVTLDADVRLGPHGHRPGTTACTRSMQTRLAWPVPWC